MIGSVISCTVLFFYIYSVLFVFLPVSTRVLFGLSGFIILLLRIFLRKINLILDKKLFYFLILLFVIPLIALVSIGINQTNDIEFIKYPFSIINIFFASYFVLKVLNHFFNNLDFKNIALLIVNVLLIQSIIALTMFFFPKLRDILIGLQRILPDDIEKISDSFEFRIIGFGTMFFGAGVISGFGLILIGALLRIYKFTSIQIIFLSSKYLIIFVAGMMMARTTLVGGLLGLMLLFFPKNFKVNISLFRKRFFFILNIVMISVILTLILFFAIPKIGKTFEPVFNFAFEIFINYFEKGIAETASTNRLKEMYLYPQNIKTWIIGDGYWTNPYGNGYYMQTDVGYLRLIYYFGIVGLGVYILYQYYLMKISFSLKNLKYFKLTLFIYLLLLNLKGFADLFPLIVIFLVSNQIQIRNKKSTFPF